MYLAISVGVPGFSMEPEISSHANSSQMLKRFIKLLAVFTNVNNYCAAEEEIGQRNRVLNLSDGEVTQESSPEPTDKQSRCSYKTQNQYTSESTGLESMPKIAQHFRTDRDSIICISP
jgi:hypothetical protein